MISSEVQRTLVKSPPELWTELSDPEALARHLGELGEIRITRTEPENLVEWEAEGTTGTVEIAPSGWGTRVTLTVVREVPAGLSEGAEAQSAAPGQSDEHAEAEAGTTAGEHTADAALPETTAENEPQDSAAQTGAEAEPGETEGAIEVGGEAAAEPVAHPPAEISTPPAAHSAPAEPVAERKPAPATEAARRAAGWPSARHAAEPAIESDLRAAEALDGPPPEPDGLQDWAVQSAEARAAEPRDEHTPEDETLAEPEPFAEPEPPKRGLFARLFGRRRGRAKNPSPLEDAAPPSEETDDAGATLVAERPGEETEIQPGELAALGQPEAEADDLEAARDETEIGHADLAALGEPELRGGAQPEPHDGGAPEPDISERARARRRRRARSLRARAQARDLRRRGRGRRSARTGRGRSARAGRGDSSARHVRRGSRGGAARRRGGRRRGGRGRIDGSPRSLGLRAPPAVLALVGAARTGRSAAPPARAL